MSFAPFVFLLLFLTSFALADVYRPPQDVILIHPVNITNVSQSVTLGFDMWALPTGLSENVTVHLQHPNGTVDLISSTTNGPIDGVIPCSQVYAGVVTASPVVLDAVGKWVHSPLSTKQSLTHGAQT
jgi:hypothetical protein